MGQILESLCAVVLLGMVVMLIGFYAEDRIDRDRAYKLRSDIDVITDGWYRHVREFPADDLAGINLLDEDQFAKFRRFLAFELRTETARGETITDGSDIRANLITMSPYNAPYTFRQNRNELWIVTTVPGTREAQTLQGILRGLNFEMTAGTWSTKDSYAPMLRRPADPAEPSDANCATFNPIVPRIEPIQLTAPNACDPAHDENTLFSVAVKIDPPVKSIIASISKKHADDYERMTQEEYNQLVAGSPPCVGSACDEEVIVTRGLAAPLPFTTGTQFNPNNSYGAVIQTDEQCSNWGALTLDDWGIPYSCRQNDSGSWVWKSMTTPACVTDTTPSATATSPISCSPDRERVGQRVSCLNTTANTATSIAQCPASSGATLIYPNGQVAGSGECEQAPVTCTPIPSHDQWALLDATTTTGPGYVYSPGSGDYTPPQNYACGWVGALSSGGVNVAYTYEIFDTSTNSVVWGHYGTAGTEHCHGTDAALWRGYFEASTRQFTDEDGNTISLYVLNPTSTYTMRRRAPNAAGFYTPPPPNPPLQFISSTTYGEMQAAGLFTDIQTTPNAPANTQFVGVDASLQGRILIGMACDPDCNRPSLYLVRVGGELIPDTTSLGCAVCPDPNSPVMRTADADPTTTPPGIYAHCPRAAGCSINTPRYTTSCNVPSEHTSTFARGGIWIPPSVQSCVPGSASVAPTGSCIVGSAPVPECCEAPSTSAICSTFPVDTHGNPTVDCDDPRFTPAMESAACPCNPRCVCADSTEAYVGNLLDTDLTNDYRAVDQTDVTARNDPTNLSDYTGQCWGRDVQLQRTEDVCPSGREEYLLTAGFPPPRTAEGWDDVSRVCEQEPICPGGYYQYTGGPNTESYGCRLEYLRTTKVTTTPSLPSSLVFVNTTSPTFVVNVTTTPQVGAVLFHFGSSQIYSSNPDLENMWVCPYSDVWTNNNPGAACTPIDVYEWAAVSYGWSSSSSWTYGCGGSLTGSSRGATCPGSAFEVDPYTRMEIPQDAGTLGAQGPTAIVEPELSWIYAQSAGALQGVSSRGTEDYASILDCAPFMESPGTVSAPAITVKGVTLPATERELMPASRTAVPPANVGYRVPKSCRFTDPLAEVTAVVCPIGATAVGSPPTACQIPHEAQMDIDAATNSIVAQACPSGMTYSQDVIHPDLPGVVIGRLCIENSPSSSVGAVQATPFTSNPTLSCGYPNGSGESICSYTYTDLLNENVYRSGSSTVSYYPMDVQDDRAITVDPTTDADDYTGTPSRETRRIEPGTPQLRTFPQTFGCRSGLINRDNYVCEQPTAEPSAERSGDEICVEPDGNDTEGDDPDSCSELTNQPLTAPHPTFRVDATRVNPNHRFNIGL